MLIFEIADLYFPNGVGGFNAGEAYNTLWHGVDGSVTIPLCNQQEAEVKVSPHLFESMGSMTPYNTRLRCWLKTDYGKFLVFDGIVTQPSLNTENETITIPAVDHSLRLEHHFIRLGDTALGDVTLTGTGIREIIDAAQNLAGNQANNYPPLGIDYLTPDHSWATNTAPPIEFSRGEQCWRAILELVGTQTAPEFMLIPIDGVPGVYQRLYTAMRLGLYDPVNSVWIPNESIATTWINQAITGGNADMPLSRAHFQAGWGADNAEMIHRPGSRLKTHVHVLADGERETTKRRVTETSGGAADYGVYVGWEQTNFKSADEENLRNRGRQVLARDAVPPDFFEVRPKGDCQYHYLRDFLVGSLVRASYKQGHHKREMPDPGRIMQVKLIQDPTTNQGHRTEIQVVPHRIFVSGNEEES